MSHATFAAAVNCIDGRVQQPVTDWLKTNCGVDYVDVITEAGPTLVLLHGTPGQLEGIRSRVQISVREHRSATVALAGHGKCAGNRAPKEKIIRETREGMDIIRSWGLPVTVIGLWVDGKTWQVERVAGIESGDDSEQDAR
jgi:hypothetical protein